MPHVAYNTGQPGHVMVTAGLINTLNLIGAQLVWNLFANPYTSTYRAYARSASDAAASRFQDLPSLKSNALVASRYLP